MEVGQIARPPARLIEALRPFNTGTISNALDRLNIRGVMGSIQPIAPEFRLVGGAVTVWEVTGELGSAAPGELRLGTLIDSLVPGDAVVIDNGGQRVSTWGGVATFAARAKGAAGLVVDGGVRDVEQIREFQFPVFARHVVPVTGKSRIKILAINQPIRVDGILVRPGDIVVGDGTGVVAIPIELAERVLELARQQEESDERTMDFIRRGHSLSEAQRLAGVK